MTLRSLVLRRESLTELATTELAAIAGGASGHASCDCPSASWMCITGGAICGETRVLCV